MSRKKKIFLAIVSIFIVIQFFGKEKPDIKTDNPADLIKSGNLAPEVTDILKNACYDCHSNETIFPAYSQVAPISWFIYGHIQHGRKKLNFSEWTTLEKTKKIKYLKEIVEVMEQNRMPLKSYTWLHRNADLSEEQVEILIRWANLEAEAIFKN